MKGQKIRYPDGSFAYASNPHQRIIRCDNCGGMKMYVKTRNQWECNKCGAITGYLG